VIVVDTRESSKAKSIVKFLGDRLGEDNVQTLYLEAGDYLVTGSKNILVERKTIWDYSSSLFGRRLWNQLLKMSQTEGVDERFILVEGSISALKRVRKDLNELAVLSSMVSVMIDWDTKIFVVPSKKYSGFFLEGLHQRVNRERGRKVFPVKAKKSYKSLKEASRGLIESLPGVGPSTADKILRVFNTARSVIFNAERLTEVQGVGEKTTKKILEVLDYDYNK